MKRDCIIISLDLDAIKKARYELDGAYNLPLAVVVFFLFHPKVLFSKQPAARTFPLRAIHLLRSHKIALFWSPLPPCPYIFTVDGPPPPPPPHANVHIFEKEIYQCYCTQNYS